MPKTDLQRAGGQCPDGGTCHHGCHDSECFRVSNCGPLSGVYPNDEWPKHDRVRLDLQMDPDLAMPADMRNLVDRGDRNRAFNSTCGATAWFGRPAREHPHCCECQDAGVPHKHRADFSCTQCECKAYDPAYHRRAEPKPATRNSVLQDWVETLPLMQQTVLLVALRGCDVVPKRGAGKPHTKALRSVVLKNADPASGFIGRDITGKAIVAEDAVGLFDMDGCECLPMHWTMHMVHAAEVVAYGHPDPEVSSAWMRFYLDAVNKLHLEPESKGSFNRRLCK